MINYLETIKEKVIIAEYISRYVQLKHKGNGEYLGCCPFHEEKTPSFTVSSHKSFFHCFGCSAHGDVISFASQYQKISYKEAMQKLANEYHIISVKSRENSSDQQKYLNIYNQLAEYYHSTLLSFEGKSARFYLKKRGIDENLWQHYKLGLSCPESTQWLMKNFRLEDLLFCKILMQRNNYTFNPFQNRLIFPIKWHDNIIAFGGRSLEDGLKPKYLNSSDSLLFHKGKVLYGLYNNALSKVKESNNIKVENHDIRNHDIFFNNTQNNNVIVVEGYMDVLAMNNVGYKNVVSPLGTAMTIDQINILWQKFHKIVVCFDNDLAGQKAMYRIANLIWQHLTPDKSITFIVLNDGKDPDEIIQSKGESYLHNLFNKEKHIVDFIFDITIKEYDLNNIESRASLRGKLRQMTINHQDLNLEYQREFNKRLYYMSNHDNKSQIFNRYKPESSFYNKNKIAILQIPTIQKGEYCHHLIVMLKVITLGYGINQIEQVACLDIDNEDIAIVRDIIVNEINMKNNYDTEATTYCNDFYKRQQKKETDDLNQTPLNSIDMQILIDKVTKTFQEKSKVNTIKKLLNYIKDFSIQFDNSVGIIDRCILMHNLFSLQHQIKQIKEKLLLYPSAELEAKMLILKKHELQLQTSLSNL